MPTVLLSNNPVIFVNLRTFMMRNTSNNMEVGIRRRPGKHHPPQSDIMAKMPIKARTNEIATNIVNGIPNPALQRASGNNSPLKPGRFAIAWATEVEESRRKVENLVQSIISLVDSFDHSKLSTLTNLTRDLGSLIQDSAEARKAFAQLAGQVASKFMASQAILLSSSNETAHEWASIVLGHMLQDERCRGIAQGLGPQLDRVLAGLLRMVTGPAAASCTRQRHAVFALQALTATAEGQQRLLAVRRTLPGAR